MLEFLKQLDIKLLLAINSIHTPVLDSFMIFITHRYTWIPLYGVLIAFLFVKKRQEFFMAIFFIIAAVVASDQFASGFIKPLFKRLRPCHHEEISSMLYLIDDICGGKYGFISSHAANTFALSTFLFLWIGKEYRWLGWFFLWAFFVSLSRVYLGVHYPSDITVGAIAGVLTGLLFYYLFRYFYQKNSWDRKE